MTFLPYSKLPDNFLAKALSWANRHSHFAYHTSNNTPYPHHGFEHMLAIGAKQIISHPTRFFKNLREQTEQKWAFGTFSYDLKNQIEVLSSSGDDLLNFPTGEFFIPEHMIFFDKEGIRLESVSLHILEQINETPYSALQNTFSQPKAHTSKAQYLEIIDKLKDHIIAGDCYEINFCQAFSGQVITLDPVTLFLQLNQQSPNPFACLQKLGEHYILSASPERFLKKQNNLLISQPIKGTRPRGNNEAEDTLLKHQLRNDEKELAENMMIVDLVRNDLARSAIPGSVQVEELFGIYTFPQVHQMISTVRATLKEQVHFLDAIQNAFPMGSMTGAPKFKVMQLIDQYEPTQRGAFSGAAGYIQPNGDFDFNVLIRSLFLNRENNIYTFQVGSAITYDAQAEKEYEECLWKAKALFSLIGH